MIDMLKGRKAMSPDVASGLIAFTRQASPRPLVHVELEHPRARIAVR